MGGFRRIFDWYGKGRLAEGMAPAWLPPLKNIPGGGQGLRRCERRMLTTGSPGVRKKKKKPFVCIRPVCMEEGQNRAGENKLGGTGLAYIRFQRLFTGVGNQNSIQSGILCLLPGRLMLQS